MAIFNFHFLQPSEEDLLVDDIGIVCSNLDGVDILSQNFLKLVAEVCFNLEVNEPVSVLRVGICDLIEEFTLCQRSLVILHDMSHEHSVGLLIGKFPSSIFFHLFSLQIGFFFLLIVRFLLLFKNLFRIVLQPEALTLQGRRRSIVLANRNELVQQNPSMVSSGKHPIDVFVSQTLYKCKCSPALCVTCPQLTMLVAATGVYVSSLGQNY